MSTPLQATTWTADRVAGLLRGGGRFDAHEIELIGSGQWSDCFAFTHQNRDLVVRVGRHVDDFRKDQVASTLAHPGLPIPELLEIDEVGPEFYAVSGRVFGDPLEQILDWPRVVTPLAELLEALRHADVSSISGWGRWASTSETTGHGPAATWREFLLQVNDDPVGDRTYGWKKRLAGFPEVAAAFARGYELLEPLIVDDVPRSLVHNDLFNRNAHVTNGVVTGVFDWGNSLVGDHLYDLALLCFWDPWFSHIDAQLLVDELRSTWVSSNAVPNFEERLRVCLLHAGLEHIGYHAFLNNQAEAMAVATRMQVVVEQRW